jgi:starch phosphorylase
VPIVGVGLLYRLGYFEQSIDADGAQAERYAELDLEHLPLELLRDEAGAPRTISLPLPDAVLHARIWTARVGRVPLLLLDANVPENAPAERAVTDVLYGGDREMRIRQELLLGVGGVRALHAFGARPDVFHMNEGHAGFLGLERMRLLVEGGLDGAQAVEAVRHATVFTTHTPVPAGIDRFDRALAERYLRPYAEQLGMPIARVLDLGVEPAGVAVDGAAGDGTFNMAVMGLRLGGRANGVSRLHGEVSRRMFRGLWPERSADAVPISHVTNGVHEDTWLAPAAHALYGTALTAGDQAAPLSTDEAALWALRSQLRGALVQEIRVRLRHRSAGQVGVDPGWVDAAFDPEALTIGFARRVPEYKRLTLMLRDPDRLRRLLLSGDRPLQIVVAGKAHPNDAPGKALIRRLVAFTTAADVRHRIAFLPEYDIRLARALVTGSDVWLNNPLRPYEACGTSGMKALLNGGLNLSVRDGWWDELYDGQNGWAIPSAEDAADPEARDTAESRALLDLLEDEVVPLFYDRQDGVPRGWLNRVRHAVGVTGPQVLASRMVRDYVEQLYVPAAVAERAR